MDFDNFLQFTPKILNVGLPATIAHAKMTPSNIHKIKKGIAVVLMIFGIVLIAQGIFPGKKEMVKNALEKIE